MEKMRRRFISLHCKRDGKAQKFPIFFYARYDSSLQNCSITSYILRLTSQGILIIIEKICRRFTSRNCNVIKK